MGASGSLTGSISPTGTGIRTGAHAADIADTLQLIGQLSTIGMSFVFALVIGFAAGYWLDGVLGTKPWLAFVGFFSVLRPAC